MRISLLLEREPFGPILEQTLARYWSNCDGVPYQVQWQMERGKGRHQTTNQVWLGNIYLNAIFSPALDPAAFDPIQREFARSTVWWKRPLQRGYVALATEELTAAYFAQAHLHIAPAPPDYNRTLIVAGNHKVRLLNHCKQSVTNLLKVGFGGHFMQRELAVRRTAASCGVPMPALLEVNEAEGWYTEAYMSGTPTNRLAGPQEAASAIRRATQALQALYEATVEPVPLPHYLGGLTMTLREQIDGHHLLTAANKNALRCVCATLAERISALTAGTDSLIETVLTHGDFQPANILVNAQGVWLIDWEYSARRQRNYDLLVFALRARSPHGLAERLQQFMQKGWPEDAPFAVSQEQGGPLVGVQQRQLQGILFLLEDLLLHLEENNQPPLTKIGDGLTQLQHEIDAWVTNNE